MILDDILASKRGEVERARSASPESALRARAGYDEPRRGFHERLRRRGGRRIIAEIKRASPSRGTIREDFAPALHAADYERCGAACISVLTDEPYFGGSLEHLAEARSACRIPLLRKDFVIDGYQIVEARAAGADAILLIVAALDDRLLRDLLGAAAAEGMDVLTEVHDERELDAALAAGAELVGINNRDLRTFETSTEVTRRLAARAPQGLTLVSESGLGDAAELESLEALGVDAFLIGETFMAAADPGAALASLLAT